MHFTEEEEKMSRVAEDVAHRVIGAAITAHEILGPGFPESVYAKALALELENQGMRCDAEHRIVITYRDVAVGEGRLDLRVEGLVVVELKVVESLLPIHTAQVISYLKMTGLPLGLLLNFNVPILKQGLRRVTHPKLYRKPPPSDSSSPLLL
jgi:GxxExxY protein